MSTACSEAADEQCGSTQGQFGEAYQAAVVACAKSFSPCLEKFTSCVAEARIEPTPTQARVKAAFCARCPGGGGYDACSTFFTPTAPGGTVKEVAVYGIGIPVLTVNDTLAAQMEACVGVGDEDAATSSVEGGVAPCDFLGFASCAQAIARAATLPQQCRDGS